jgi:UDP-N-acetylglucosamine 2-epimerase (non-hydrolysing)
MLQDFGLSMPDHWLARGIRGSDLEHPRQIPIWLAQIWARFARRRGELRRALAGDGRRPLVIVHGDTLTSVMAAMMGRLLRAPVAHVEAGMRSGDWRNPFPEELNRRMTAKLARIHFAPGPRAVQNLRAERTRGEIIDTGRNTISDNLRDIPAGFAPGLELPQEGFGIVSLHRQELLYDRDELSAILAVLRESALHQSPLLFVDHSIAAAAIDSAGLGGVFDSRRFVRIRRQRYFQFLSLLKASSFLVTDSGGSQEECAFLGHPCLIHRAVTEHSTGLDGSVVLSRMDLDTVRRFLDDPEAHRTEPALLDGSPSEQIVDYLADRGFASPPGESDGVREGDSFQTDLGYIR